MDISRRLSVQASLPEVSGDSDQGSSAPFGHSVGPLLDAILPVLTSVKIVKKICLAKLNGGSKETSSEGGF